MYHSVKERRQKVKELEQHHAFLEYARNQFEAYKKVDGVGWYNTFEEYLVVEVFNLYECFTMLEPLNT